MTKKHCEKYDAYFESRTGKWLEEKCEDKKCEFCGSRPDKHTSHKWGFTDGSKEVCS